MFSKNKAYILYTNQYISQFKKNLQEQKQKLIEWYAFRAPVFFDPPFDIDKAFQDPGYVWSYSQDYLPPFRIACELGYVETVQYLLLNHKENCFAFTFDNQVYDEEIVCLQKAITHSQPKILTLLLQAGFSVDKRNTHYLYRQCPLALAIRKNNTEAVKILVQYGASLDNITGHYHSDITVRAFVEIMKADKSTTKTSHYNKETGRWDIVVFKPNCSISPEMLELLQELEEKDNCRPEF